MNRAAKYCLFVGFSLSVFATQQKSASFRIFNTDASVEQSQIISCRVEPYAKRQGEIKTQFQFLDSQTTSAKKPLFWSSVQSSNGVFNLGDNFLYNNFPNVGRVMGNCPNGVCPSGDCPNGNCPSESCPNGVCPLNNGLRANSDLNSNRRGANPKIDAAIRSVARVYNAYQEPVPHSEAALGTMKRNVVEKGSGAFLADALGNQYVLTAAHIFRDGRGTISVQSVDGQYYSASLEFASDECDVALLRLDERTDVPTLTVSQSWPRQGETVWRAGFGPNETLKVSSGIVKGYVKTSRNDAYETLKIDGVARQGDSGGPVCNASGEIVGVVWGTDGSDAYATYSGRVLKTLCDYSTAFQPFDVDDRNALQNKTRQESQNETTLGIDATTPINNVLSPINVEQNNSNIAAYAKPKVEQESPALIADDIEQNANKNSRNVFQNWTETFWNGAFAVVFLFTVGYCGALTARKTQTAK